MRFEEALEKDATLQRLVAEHGELAIQIAWTIGYTDATLQACQRFEAIELRKAA